MVDGSDITVKEAPEIASAAMELYPDARIEAELGKLTQPSTTREGSLPRRTRPQDIAQAPANIQPNARFTSFGND